MRKKTKNWKIVLEIRSHNAKESCIDDYLTDLETNTSFQEDKNEMLEQSRGKSLEVICELETFKQFYDKYFHTENLPTGFNYPVMPIAHKRFPIADQLGIISATMPEEADATKVSDTVQSACADAINDGSSQAKLVLTNTNAGHIRFAQPGHPPETI